jgi:hypothetical protein
MAKAIAVQKEFEGKGGIEVADADQVDFVEGRSQKGCSMGNLSVQSQSIVNKLLAGQVWALKNELQKHELAQKRGSKCAIEPMQSRTLQSSVNVVYVSI